MVILSRLIRSWRMGGTAMTRTVTASEAKANLGEWIRIARAGEPVVVTHHGRPVAALVAYDDLAQLERLRAAGPDSGLVSVAGGWEGSGDVAEALADVRRGAPRPAPELP
jgi:prevent-host-death family protein